MNVCTVLELSWSSERDTLILLGFLYTPTARFSQPMKVFDPNHVQKKILVAISHVGSHPRHDVFDVRQPAPANKQRS